MRTRTRSPRATHFPGHKVIIIEENDRGDFANASLSKVIGFARRSGAMVEVGGANKYLLVFSDQPKALRALTAKQVKEELASWHTPEGPAIAGVA